MRIAERITSALYQARNWKAHYRAIVRGSVTTIAALVGVRVVNLTYRSELQVRVTRGAGYRASLPRWRRWLHDLGFQARDLGIVSRRVVTTQGVKFLVDDFNAGGQEVSNMRFHDSGTGTVAEAVTDTDLGTPAGPTTRATGSQASALAGANATYTTVGTIAYTSTLAITEHGLFNQAARGAGSFLWDRSVFAAINVVNGDSIQFTYVLTANSGG